MQTLVYKASLQGLTVPIRTSGLSPGQAVELVLEPNGKVAVFVERGRRWSAAFQGSRLFRLGYLSDEVGDKIAPVLQDNTHLRVRIVEIEPAHTRPNGQDIVCISIWGPT